MKKNIGIRLLKYNRQANNLKYVIKSSSEKCNF